MAKSTLDREQVIAAAAKLANEQGIESVTLTQVAKRLGVRQPALYRHVDGFDDLMRSLGLMGREILAEALTDAAIGVAGDAAVAAVGRAWRQMVLENKGLYAATDRFPCAGDAELEAAVERIVAILGQALASYDLSDDERVHAARSLRSAFHGFSHLAAGDGHPFSHDPDDTFDHLIELLCAGLWSRENNHVRG